jgi:hypothetical protein
MQPLFVLHGVILPVIEIIFITHGGLLAAANSYTHFCDKNKQQGILVRGSDNTARLLQICNYPRPEVIAMPGRASAW